jgi:molybdopterin synthase sulfur carrier subunit
MIIKYFSWLKTFTETDQEIIEDHSITDVNSLKEYLIRKYPKLKKYFCDNNLVRVAINYSYSYDNEKIQQDDEIAFFPPVSGG